jgi:hypothetical protein
MSFVNPPRNGEGDRDAKRRGGGVEGFSNASTPPPCSARSPSPFRGGM